MTQSRPDSGDARTAAIIIIGNEVLSGKVVDANSPFLLKELYSLGVRVQRVLTIPDELEVIADEVREAANTHHYVFTTGGVGPTHDDVTFKGVAKAFGVELFEHPALRELLENHYHGQLTEAARRMTLVPEGTELLHSGETLYPVTVVRNVYVFPGVPEFLRAKFTAIRERFRDAPYHLTRIYTHQTESVLAEHLEQTLTCFPGIEIGSYPKYDTREYKVMLTLECKDPALLSRARDHLLTRMEPDKLVRVDES